MTSALSTASMERRFPLNPRLNPSTPFRDTSGQNPFAEQGPDEPISDDPYSSPAAPAVQPYKPGDYEPVLADRSAWILARDRRPGPFVGRRGNRDFGGGGVGRTCRECHLWNSGRAAGIVRIDPRLHSGRRDPAPSATGLCQRLEHSAVRAGFWMSIAGAAIGALVVAALPASVLLNVL